MAPLPQHSHPSAAVVSAVICQAGATGYILTKAGPQRPSVDVETHHRPYFEHPCDCRGVYCPVRVVVEKGKARNAGIRVDELFRLSEVGYMSKAIMCI